MLWVVCLVLFLTFSFEDVCATKLGTTGQEKVNVFHVIDNDLWGEVDGSYLQGSFSCGDIDCNVYSSDSKTNLLRTVIQKFESFHRHPAISVALYNIHSWKMISKSPHKPAYCELPTDLNIAESEESHSRFHNLFDSSFPYFDGNSTTWPSSSIPRAYVSALNVTEFLPQRPFNSLIKGASFVASTCHRGRGTTKRELVVEIMRKQIRVDGLGKCMQSRPNAEGIVLTTGGTALENLRLKQQAISNYLFHFSFENSYEPGYVTEKVFDALIAGIVPVYLGPSDDCKRLLPTPSAAIFIDDFDGDFSKVADYLIYLSRNETAYELHRNWRNQYIKNQSSFRISPLLVKSWPCRVCEWASEEMAGRGIFTSMASKGRKGAGC